MICVASNRIGSDTPSSSGHQNAALLFTIKILANQRIAEKRLQIQIFGQKKITLVSHFYHKIATFHINDLLSQNHHKIMILCSKDKVRFSSQIYVHHISITKLRFCGMNIILVLSSFSWCDILITKPSHNHDFVFKKQSDILSTNICPSHFHHKITLLWCKYIFIFVIFFLIWHSQQKALYCDETIISFFFA